MTDPTVSEKETVQDIWMMRRSSPYGCWLGSSERVFYIYCGVYSIRRRTEWNATKDRHA